LPQRRLTDSHLRRRNPRRGFEMMKMARLSAIETESLEARVGASLTLSRSPWKRDGRLLHAAGRVGLIAASKMRQNA
jgi:hypothetical protein